MTQQDTTSAHVDGLNPSDPGVTMLAKAVAGQPAREILLVCGGDLPGVGAEATRWVLDLRELSDSRAQAIAVGLDPSRGLDHDFGHAIVWPRSHLGKDFSVGCLARGALALRPGGSLWCAVRKNKGAQSLAKEMGALMGEVDVVDRDRGYRLLQARRTDAFDEAKARQVLEQRYVIEHPLLPGLSLRSAPGVFSRRELDAGTRVLIEHAARHGAALTPSRVLDLGCGVGPLALWAATRFDGARVLAVDSNLLAVDLATDNAARHGLAERVRVLASDGLPADPSGPVLGMRGRIELALVNPPTHAEPETLGHFSRQLGQWLAPDAVAMLVVSRAGRMTEQLRGAGARVTATEYERYTVLEARWPAP